MQNWQDFPADMFAPVPNLPPCGSNANASRTWVDFKNADTDEFIYGFCAFNKPEGLKSLWFGVAQGDAPPKRVILDLWDRQEDRHYLSAPVTLP